MLNFTIYLPFRVTLRLSKAFLFISGFSFELKVITSTSLQGQSALEGSEKPLHTDAIAPDETGVEPPWVVSPELMALSLEKRAWVGGHPAPSPCVVGHFMGASTLILPLRDCRGIHGTQLLGTWLWQWRDKACNSPHWETGFIYAKPKYQS